MRIRFLLVPFACCVALFASLVTNASAQGLFLNPVDSQNPIEYVSPELTDPQSPIIDVQNSPDPSGMDAMVTDPEQAPSSNPEETPFGNYLSITSSGAITTISYSLLQQLYTPYQTAPAILVVPTAELIVPTAQLITRVDPQVGPPSDYLAAVPEPSTMAFGILCCALLLARRFPLFTRQFRFEYASDIRANS